MAQVEIESLIRQSWAGTPDSDEWLRIADAVVSMTLEWEFHQASSEEPHGRYAFMNQAADRILQSTAQRQMALFYRPPTEEVNAHLFSAVVPDEVAPLRVWSAGENVEPPYSLGVNAGTIIYNGTKISAGRDISFSDTGNNPVWMGAGARSEYLNLDRPYAAQGIAVGAGEISDLFTNIARTEGVQRKHLLGALFHVGLLAVHADVRLPFVPELKTEASEAIERCVALENKATALATIQAGAIALHNANLALTNTLSTPWIYERYPDHNGYESLVGVSPMQFADDALKNQRLAESYKVEVSLLREISGVVES